QIVKHAHRASLLPEGLMDASRYSTFGEEEGDPFLIFPDQDNRFVHAQRFSLLRQSRHQLRVSWLGQAGASARAFVSIRLTMPNCSSILDFSVRHLSPACKYFLLFSD